MSNLNLDTEGKLRLTVDDLTTNSTAVLGMTGSGKSNTVAVLAEELLAANAPLGLIDIAGEYWGLKEQFPILVVGKSDHVDVEIEPSQAAAIAEFSFHNRLSVVLDLLDYEEDEQFQVVDGFIRQLWKLSRQIRQPYRIILEEAQNYVPQSGNTPVKKLLLRVATEGRKRGLGLIIASQRPANIDKTMLGQAKIRFLHQVVDTNDIDAYIDRVPRLLMPAKEVERTAFSLQPGQAIFVSGTSLDVVQIRLRHTFHAGYTPGLQESTMPKLQSVDTSVLVQLQEALQTPKAAGAGSESEAALQAEIDRLKKLLVARDKEIASLKAKPEKPAPQPDDKKGAAPTDSALKAKAAQWVENKQNKALERQKQRFNLLLSNVRRSKALHREILAYLMLNDGRHEADKLARILGHDPVTLYKNPPLDFVRLGVVVREKRNGQYFYSGSKQKLCEIFPSLDLKTMVSQLVKVGAS